MDASLPMDELLGVAVETGPVDVVIADPIVDRLLPFGRGRLIADRTSAILEIPSVAVFSAQDGARVRVQRTSSSNDAIAEAWLQNLVAALLLAQRGDFALHASVVEVGGFGVAICGHRRAGKSTTALRLAQRGHRLVIDDFAPIDTEDPVTVQPCERPVQFFEQTAEALDLDVSQAVRRHPGHPKLSIEVETSGAVPLRAVVMLAPSAEEPTVSVVRVTGSQALWLLVENAYRTRQLTEIYGDQMFAWAGRLAARVPICSLTRSAAAWTADEVADAVLEASAAGSPQRGADRP